MSAPSPQAQAVPSIPNYVFKLPEWRRRVALAWEDLNRHDTLEGGALRRLVLLKRAIREVSLRMHSEHSAAVADLEPDDCLGITMGFLRAIEGFDFTRARRLASRYPLLGTFVDLSRGDLHEDAGLSRVRDHAVELARENLMGDMKKHSREESDLPEPVRQSRRQRFHARLLRLRPGSTASLQAIVSSDGSIHTEVDAIAGSLAEHWGAVFAAKPHSDEKI